ncbi:MAG: undecaprenyl-diphosphate phosphatase [Ruminococcaceae bacterium]|nr:undecaprenyl-diphosphate phosphatase [Oscillospiraceae bacterium]
MLFLEILKAIFIGIVQGITEWLPVSSTGHMIIANEFVNLNISNGAWELFEVITQLGSILAVVILFFEKLNPLKKVGGRVAFKPETVSLWVKVIIAVLPAAVIGVLLDDWLESKFYNFVVVAIMLIAYGIAFIVVERINKKKRFRYTSVNQLDKKTSFKIGCFQVLSLIPGTSRSGSTILGASLVGVSRTAAAEFSFFLAIPVMAGATLLKTVKAILIDGISLTATEILIIYVGTLTAFLVSLGVIKFLMSFVKKHTFESFGWYRIILGIILLVYYFIIK